MGGIPVGSRAARFAEVLDGGLVRCLLCPHACVIGDGEAGFCRVRRNAGGRLVTLAYGNPVAVHVDPVEKKPLFHFHPGTSILSIGMAGCNLDCDFCQNHDLSRAAPGELPTIDLPPARAVEVARANACRSIAFTYNEPGTFAEYVVDVSRAAHAAGLRTAMVTNGYMTTDAVREVYADIDAANVDLKAFDEDFYRRVCRGSLAPVLDALVVLKAMDVWIELTTLLVPGLNDDPAAVAAEARWIAANLGASVPLHLTAYHPAHRWTDPPRTPRETLRIAREAALDAGLEFVYEGNVDSDGANTYCPSCRKLLVRRSWNAVLDLRLEADGRCRCGRAIPMRT
jgi:pyruvate formate lyase activating enzyme